MFTAQKENNNHPQVVAIAVSANHYGESQALIKRHSSTIIVFLPRNKADSLRLRFDQRPMASNAQIL